MTDFSNSVGRLTIPQYQPINSVFVLHTWGLILHLSLRSLSQDDHKNISYFTTCNLISSFVAFLKAKYVPKIRKYIGSQFHKALINNGSIN